jgi:hypothetical protein
MSERILYIVPTSHDRQVSDHFVCLFCHRPLQGRVSNVCEHLSTGWWIMGAICHTCALLGSQQRYRTLAQYPENADLLDATFVHVAAVMDASL